MARGHRVLSREELATKKVRRGSLARLVLKTLLITPSGALSPGPLSASAVALGAKLGFMGGLVEAVGHTLFELPYVALLVRGYGGVRRFIERYERVMTLVVVGFLVWFGILLLRDAARAAAGGIETNVSVTAGSLLDAALIGLALTGGNVYFLLWWLTVGLPLVRDAAREGAAGFAVMYASHVWMDYAWLGLLAAAGGLARLLSPQLYAGVLAALALLLLVFAADIAVRTYLGRRLLPL